MKGKHKSNNGQRRPNDLQSGAVAAASTMTRQIFPPPPSPSPAPPPHAYFSAPVHVCVWHGQPPNKAFAKFAYVCGKTAGVGKLVYPCVCVCVCGVCVCVKVVCACEPLKLVWPAVCVCVCPSCPPHIHTHTRA